jgi:hypothetical protein
MTADSNAETTTTGASALAGNQHDYGTDRAKFTSHTVDQDVGADERYKTMGADAADSWRVNGKRTYDLHQTLDTDHLVKQRTQQAKLDSIEMAEREQRMRHTEAEFNQRMRHADRMDAISNSVISATLGDMAEKLGRIEEKVCK